MPSKLPINSINAYHPQYDTYELCYQLMVCL